MADRLQEDYLRDIIEHIAHITNFVEGVSYTEFLRNVEKIFAVIRALEIIGEAANHIAPQFRSRYPSVPWQEMIGMRNIVVHGYFGVNTAVIWRTVQEDIPPLRKQIEQILLELINTEE